MDKALVRRLEHYLGNAEEKELKILLGYALKASNLVGHDIYYSIVTGISYEELYKLNAIPTSKSNFYRLKLQTLNDFEVYLQGKRDNDPRKS